jgi:signal transduction histidine kinase
VLPSISMALDNAITYRALADYRDNLERKVQVRTAELVSARDELADTVRSLEEAQAARERIFANINHEIRTPLTLVILSVTELKARLAPALDGRAIEELLAIETSTRKLLRLVDELLLLAAGRAGKLQLRLAACDLAQLIRLVVAAWRVSAETKSIDLAYQGPERLVREVDEEKMERVVTNLVSNATKFTPSGGSVSVELRERDGAAEILVRDTGMGIDDDLKKRLFGRFEQGRPSLHAGARGSGLGLSLVKDLVEAHGGEVGFESPRGGGSIFRVLLPADARPRAEVVAMSDTLERGALRLVPADFESQTPAPTAAMLAPASTPEGTVLVAEDDPRLLEAIGKLLSARYRVLLAGDGISALRLARAHLPDLLVSDVGMPGMDGLELTRRFRELPGNRLAPVVLLTAFSSLSDRLSGFEAGAIDYVAKPFDPAELLARVRSQLEIRALALKLHQSEKLAALGTLSAGLAHEMRNPANAIVNAIGPLSELLPPELIGDDHPVGQLIGVLRECAAQIALLSRQLLGFKRQGELERAENRLTDVIGRARALVQPLFKNVTLKESLEYRGSLSCAAPLLTQVLANLLDNAAHAAGPGGWVQLGSRSDGNRLVLEVSDSGPGVPPELRERIFEPFFTTKPPGAGTGLGLTTARQIVERHGGTLDVRDGASGSVFRIELPLGDSGKALMAASDRKTGGVG